MVDPKRFDWTGSTAVIIYAVVGSVLLFIVLSVAFVLLMRSRQRHLLRAHKHSGDAFGSPLKAQVDVRRPPDFPIYRGQDGSGYLLSDFEEVGENGSEDAAILPKIREVNATSKQPVELGTSKKGRILWPDRPRRAVTTQFTFDRSENTPLDAIAESPRPRSVSAPGAKEVFELPADYSFPPIRRTNTQEDEGESETGLSNETIWPTVSGQMSRPKPRGPRDRRRLSRRQSSVGKVWSVLPSDSRRSSDAQANSFLHLQKHTDDQNSDMAVLANSARPYSHFPNINNRNAPKHIRFSSGPKSARQSRSMIRSSPSVGTASLSSMGRDSLDTLIAPSIYSDHDFRRSSSPPQTALTMPNAHWRQSSSCLIESRDFGCENPDMQFDATSERPQPELLSNHGGHQSTSNAIFSKEEPTYSKVEEPGLTRNASLVCKRPSFKSMLRRPTMLRKGTFGTPVGQEQSHPTSAWCPNDVIRSQTEDFNVSKDTQLPSSSQRLSEIPHEATDRRDRSLHGDVALRHSRHEIIQIPAMIATKSRNSVFEGFATPRSRQIEFHTDPDVITERDSPIGEGDTQGHNAHPKHDLAAKYSPTLSIYNCYNRNSRLLARETPVASFLSLETESDKDSLFSTTRQSSRNPSLTLNGGLMTKDLLSFPVRSDLTVKSKAAPFNQISENLPYSERLRHSATLSRIPDRSSFVRIQGPRDLPSTDSLRNSIMQLRRMDSEATRPGAPRASNIYLSMGQARKVSPSTCASDRDGDESIYESVYATSPPDELPPLQRVKSSRRQKDHTFQRNSRANTDSMYDKDGFLKV